MSLGLVKAFFGQSRAGRPLLPGRPALDGQVPGRQEEANRQKYPEPAAPNRPGQSRRGRRGGRIVAGERGLPT